MKRTYKQTKNQEKGYIMMNRCCPVCGEHKQMKIEHISMQTPGEYHLPDNYDVVVCEKCGMVYADTSASMEDYDWYYTNCNFYGDDTKDDGSQRYEWMEELLEQYLSKESVLLEFGAGNGRYVKALQKHGYKFITGTDPSQESVERMRESGINSYIANVYSDISEREQNKYDAIFLFEVAEHLLMPQKAVKNIVSMLDDRGYFMLSVPDYSAIADSVYDIPNYFNLEHINYFSENSMDYLMAQFGMQRVNKKGIGEDLILVYQKTDQIVAAKKDLKTQDAIKKYFENQVVKKEKIKAVIQKIAQEKRELVIWGTGSYVMNLFATTTLGKCQIIGFVDNNKLKQGRQFCGYKIYTPEWLQNKQYTVLICSMLYGAQIKKQLEQMHTQNQIITL